MRKTVTAGLGGFKVLAGPSSILGALPESIHAVVLLKQLIGMLISLILID